MILCFYGCGQEAIFQFKNKKSCCSSSVNKCMGKRKRDSLKKTGKKKDPCSEETKKKLREKRKGKTYEELYGIKKAKETKRKIRENRIESWKDRDYQQKQKEAKELRPNKCEIEIQKVLDVLYPGEWKYTGDYSFWINGKNPDFTCTNGKKLIIEHFGTWYHKGNDPEEREKIFSEFGYRTLVIWENELKDMKEVENKIRNFIEY